jgi:hypothetical protein
MIVDRYDPMNLFELVPKLNFRFEPELAQLDELLDDDVLFERVKADLSLSLSHSVIPIPTVAGDTRRPWK